MLARKIRENKADVLEGSAQNLMGIGSAVDDLIYGIETQQEELHLPCSTEFRGQDKATGVVFRDCMIDYTSCMEAKCIKKLV